MPIGSKAAALLGSIKTAKKAEAARRNGALGGRPVVDSPFMRFRPYSPQWRIIRNIQNSARSYAGVSRPKFEILVGCKAEFFFRYLERRFKPGMTWDNYGKKGWIIDHVKAKAHFDFRKQSEIFRCYNYRNSQPIWDWENDQKRIINREYLRKFPKPKGVTL